MGITFRTQKCYLCVKIDEDSSLPQFAQLEDILTLQDSTDIILVVSLLRTVRFWSRFAAYEVEAMPKSFSCFYVCSLKCHYLFNCVLIARRNYIKCKYDLSGYL